jgi:hypothetical protein
VMHKTFTNVHLPPATLISTLWIFKEQPRHQASLATTLINQDQPITKTLLSKPLCYWLITRHITLLTLQPINTNK